MSGSPLPDLTGISTSDCHKTCGRLRRISPALLFLEREVCNLHITLLRRTDKRATTNATIINNSDVADPWLSVTHAAIEVSRGLAVSGKFFGHIRNGLNRRAVLIATYQGDFHKGLTGQGIVTLPLQSGDQ